MRYAELPRCACASLFAARESGWWHSDSIVILLIVHSGPGARYQVVRVHRMIQPRHAIEHRPASPRPDPLYFNQGWTDDERGVRDLREKYEPRVVWSP